MPRLFGTNGIRGLVGREIGVESTFKLGCSVALLFRRGRVFVGRDGRDSSPMLSESMLAGLLSQGVDVVDAGVITTPALQFLVKTMSAAGGVMVTASHNPPEYNGFKVIDFDGIEIPREKEEKVERLLHDDRWKTGRETGSRLKPEGLLETYLDRLKDQFGRETKTFGGLRVVVDSGNGVSALTTPRILSLLGCDVVTVNDNIDGRFPGRPSEPRPETLSMLSGLVREERADIGIAHDGDGDRALFADESGKVHWGDRTFALVEDEVLRESKGGKVVTPLNSSMAVAEIARRRGGRLILTKVGSIYVSRKMVEIGAVLGGEENGGIFYAPHHPVRDGTVAALLVLKAMVKNKMPLSKLLGRLPSFFMAKEKFPCRDDAQKKRAMARLKTMLAKRVTSKLDGVRVDLKDKGWVLVRPSGTEPLIRLYAEGRTEQHLSDIVNEFRPMVLQSLKG